MPGRKKGCAPPPNCWKPGKSGNPRGRPRRGLTFKEIAADALAARDLQYTVGAGDKEQKVHLTTDKSFKHVLFAGLMRKAMTGDVFAIREIHDWVDGKVADKVQITERPSRKIVFVEERLASDTKGNGKT